MSARCLSPFPVPRRHRVLEPTWSIFTDVGSLGLSRPFDVNLEIIFLAGTLLVDYWPLRICWLPHLCVRVQLEMKW